MTSNKVCWSIPEFDRIIATAFQADAENLLSEFEKKRSFKFSDFSSVWKGLMFSYIFSEQPYYTLIETFMDNSFFIIKKFIMFPRNIYTEVGALYLLYALYFKQTICEWVKIRITSEEYVVLENLIHRLQGKGELEPLFIFDKLVKANAFNYVFQRKVLAPEPRYLKNCVDFIDDTFQMHRETNPRNNLKNMLNEGNFLENFTQTLNDYRQALSNFAVYNPGLSTFSSTLVDDLNSLLEENSSSSDSE